MATRTRGNKRAREEETLQSQQGDLLNEWRQVHKDKRQAENFGRKSAPSKTAATTKTVVGSKANAKSSKTAKTSLAQTAPQGSASPGSIERFLTKTRRQKDQEIVHPEQNDGDIEDETAPAAVSDSVVTNSNQPHKDTGAATALPSGRKEDTAFLEMSDSVAEKEGVRSSHPSEDAMQISEDQHPQSLLNTRKQEEMKTEERSAGSSHAPLHASPKKASRRAIALMQAAQVASPSKAGEARPGSAASEALEFLDSEKRISFAELARKNAEKGTRSAKPPRRAVNRALVPHVLERSQRIERVERVEEKKMLQFELPAEKRGAEEVEVKTEEAAKARGGAEVESEKRGEIRSKADLRALLPRVLGEEEAVMLPQRFHRLLQQFDCLDTALSFAKSRHKTAICTWPDLRKSVESLLKRDFPLDNLRQICAVNPHAYQLYWVDLGKGNTLALTFSSPPPSSSSSSAPPSSSRPTPSALRERKEEFRAALVERVREQHTSFLSKLRPRPPAPPPGMKHTAWHPDFIVEHVRDIELADLPKQPQQLEEEKRAREEEGTLAKAKEGASDAVTAALSHLLAARKEQGSAEKPREGGEGEEGPKQGLKKERKELAGISTSLIEKVRARERAAREAREAEERKRAGRKKTAPCVSERSVSHLLEMMHSFFRLRGASRRAIPLSAFANQLVSQHSDSTVTREEVLTQLKWVVEELPMACAMVSDPIDGTPIFQLSPTFDLQAARSAVAARLG